MAPANGVDNEIRQAFIDGHGRVTEGEVVVVERKSMVVRSDTITFRADALRNGQEKVAEDFARMDATEATANTKTLPAFIETMKLLASLDQAFASTSAQPEFVDDGTRTARTIIPAHLRNRAKRAGMIAAFRNFHIRKMLRRSQHARCIFIVKIRRQPACHPTIGSDKRGILFGYGGGVNGGDNFFNFAGSEDGVNFG